MNCIGSQHTAHVRNDEKWLSTEGEGRSRATSRAQNCRSRQGVTSSRPLVGSEGLQKCVLIAAGGWVGGRGPAQGPEICSGSGRRQHTPAMQLDRRELELRSNLLVRDGRCLVQRLAFQPLRRGWVSGLPYAVVTTTLPQWPRTKTRSLNRSRKS